jgi:hypothetical protein
MEGTRLALIGPSGTVENVILAPPGVDADWPGEVLGLAGTWAVDADDVAGVGFLHLPDLALFVPPAPFPSWALDAAGTWQPPVPRPEDENLWIWNEEAGAWDLYPSQPFESDPDSPA